MVCSGLEGKSTGLYVHVPFCHSECTYCDFYRVSYRDQLADSFLEALEIEACGVAEGLRPRTIYVGGGTPSALKECQLERLLEILRPFQEEGQEYTFEVNPRSITRAKVELLKNAGVSRASFGAQTFNDQALAMLGRRHRGGDISRAYDLLRESFSSISFDLIFALPGQTLEAWDNDLSSALALSPDHLSAYSLVYEAGTPLERQVSKGDLSPVSEDLEREMFLRAIDRLTSRGYEHYEISSYSRPGHRSVHNQGYWRQEDYVGLGPGACSTVGNNRYLNVRSLEGYIRGLKEVGVVPREVEYLSHANKLNEFILLRLRTAEGLPLSIFRERFGTDLSTHCQGKLEDLIEQGFLTSDADCVRLTLEGLCVADRVISELLASDSSQPGQ